MTSLEIHREERIDGLVYFELEGCLDAHSFEKLDALLERHFNQGSYRFVVDVRRVGYLSSAGAGVFIGAAGTCQDNSGNVVLIQPPHEVTEILELLGVYRIFPVVDGIDQAREHFEQEEREAVV